MTKLKGKKMFIRQLCAGVALSLLLAAGGASAQQLSNQQLISSLSQIAKTAPMIDPALLTQEANANVGKGVAGQPSWSQLANLSQLLVEIDFENDSIAIEPKSYRTIGLIADALHHPNLMFYKFLVVGHTSSTGDAKHNLKLSQERAHAITEALATTFAIPRNRLYSVGVGQEMPVDPADPKAAANRRVQLINLG
ncbi:outer membrane protein OmpA-like peptidoglycan-associated protein, partial [Phyllobacterium sp. 1468]|uniref:OmpA family protein n=1 Tax=Phyllobacterium sp. 1468 TaxID=2817759 RepID=UPI0028585EF7|nr:outer membrane protein OmpA-like peptidoglycan-associated protein [Phyllobacterium sp. 1468]